MALRKRESKAVEPMDVFSRLDKMFDEWTRSWPLYGGLEPRWRRLGADMIRVDEYREGSTAVIRAELPGIDPEQDVELTLAEGMLHIEAQRRTEEEEEEKGYVRRELRYGSFSRTLPLPEGVSESDIGASYQDGILEIRIALPEVAKPPEPKQIPVSRS